MGLTSWDRATAVHARTTLGALSLVCSWTRPIAQEELFRKLTLRFTPVANDERGCQRLLKTLSRHPDLAAPALCLNMIMGMPLRDPVLPSILFHLSHVTYLEMYMVRFSDVDDESGMMCFWSLSSLTTLILRACVFARFSYLSTLIRCFRSSLCTLSVSVLKWGKASSEDLAASWEIWNSLSV